MKNSEYYVAPSKTAILVDCAACKGSGFSPDTVRLVNSEGHEQEVDQVCKRCEGSGKIWEDTKEVKIPVEINYTLAFLPVVLMSALILALMVITGEKMLFLVSVPLGIGYGAWLGKHLEKQKENTTTLQEAFYTKTSEPVQIQGKLTQQ